MRTYTITIDETQFVSEPEVVFRAIKGVTSIEPQENKPLSPSDWVRPGRPATDEEILISAQEAEASTFTIGIEEARKRTHALFNSQWKK
jgi:hypothetical protein